MMSYIRNIVIVLMLFLTGTASMSARTPVEEVIAKYEDASGARSFSAQGMKMILARKLMKSTQISPVASDVDTLAILKMQGAAQSVQQKFVHDLDQALKSYKYYGSRPSKNGEVEVYYLPSGPDKVSELVIYNPSIFSLNYLAGHFTLQQLLALDKPDE